MRYAQRGGYTPEEQERRERLRMRAAERFERGESIEAVAEEFRVTVPTVRTWRRRWRESGAEALRSKGPVSVERLSARQWARLEQELRRGPAAHGFTDDQRWTLKRVRTLIGRLFHVGYTVQGVWKLLRRHGWSCQVPVRPSAGACRTLSCSAPSRTAGLGEVSVPQASTHFGEALRERRLDAGMSLTALSRVVHYSKAQLSKVERGIKTPSRDLVRLCDAALGAGGSLVALIASNPPSPSGEPATGEVIEEEWTMHLSPDGPSSFDPVDRRTVMGAGAASLMAVQLQAGAHPPPSGCRDAGGIAFAIHALPPTRAERGAGSAPAGA